jgi:hypothetical protein
MGPMAGICEEGIRVLHISPEHSAELFLCRREDLHCIPKEKKRVNPI